MFTKTGTLQYMAPEMFTLANYDESVDMWAIGTYYYNILKV
jgi:serine/threonine protein kinase